MLTKDNNITGSFGISVYSFHTNIIYERCYFARACVKIMITLRRIIDICIVVMIMRNIAANI